MLGIALTIFGFIFLVKGRIPYGKKKELRGGLVYFIALLMIPPGPIFFIYGFMEGWNAGVNGGQLDEDKLIKETLMIELPVYAGIGLLSWLIVATNAKPIHRKPNRYDDNYDDDDDDRRRRRYDDERDDDRPRGRYDEEDRHRRDVDDRRDNRDDDRDRRWGQ